MRSRLGDDIDDFCVKCKRVMNHLVVSLLNDEPAKVRCRTCHGDHDFRHEQAPPPKIDARKAALIQQALEKVAAAASGIGAAPDALTAEILATDPLAAEEIPAVHAAVALASEPKVAVLSDGAAAPLPQSAARTPARKNARAK